MDIAIIGAGIAGILTALELSKNRAVNTITIFEKKPHNSIPRKHCSGIVSRDTLEHIQYAYRFIENSYSIINITISNKLELELFFNKNSIYKINRVAHEKYLIDTILSKGIDIRYKSHVIDVKHSGKIILENGNILSYNSIVIAEGYPPRLSRLAGLRAYIEPIYSIQQDVCLGKKLLNNIDKLYVYLGLERFSWLIPITERKAVIGIATRGNPSKELEIFKKFFEKKLSIEISKTLDIYGGVVLRGYPANIVRDNIVGIGDTIASVKSISGGGLYPISIISKIYGENIHILNNIEKKLKDIIKELRQQYKLYKFMKKIIGLNIIPMRKIAIEVNNSYFYDHHEKLFAKIITSDINIH